MPYIFDYHYKKMPKSSTMNELVKLLDFETSNFYYEFKEYFKKIGLTDDFINLGIDIELHLEDLNKNVNQERLRNNPVNINIYKLFKK